MELGGAPSGDSAASPESKDGQETVAKEKTQEPAPEKQAEAEAKPEPEPKQETSKPASPSPSDTKETAAPKQTGQTSQPSKDASSSASVFGNREERRVSPRGTRPLHGDTLIEL